LDKGALEPEPVSRPRLKVVVPRPREEWNYTPDFLDLSRFWRTLAVKKTDHDYVVIAELLTPPSSCPDCNSLPAKQRPNGTIVQTLVDEPREGRRVKINFIRQRYQCTDCGRNTLQPLADVVRNRAITARGANYMYTEALSRSFEDVALNTGTSGRTAKEVFADRVCELDRARTIVTPEVLGIDGVCVGHNKHKKTYCMLTDISKHSVLELLQKSTMLEVARFLKQLPEAGNLKVVAIDMSRGFLGVILKLYPKVVVVIDSYHVLRLLNDAVTAVVKGKQENLSKAEHEELMQGGNRFLLLKRRCDLTKEEKNKMERWFARVPEFRQAFELKEEVYDIWKLTRRREAERRYEEWRRKIPGNLEPAFRKFTGAVKRWRPYVFNYFDHRVTNAFTESKNREVKSLQRQGRRVSFAVLRARLLYGGINRKPSRPQDNVNVGQIRAAIKRAKEAQKPQNRRDPKSYVARIEAAHKSTNEFSKLLRPHQGWDERFGHYSCYSEEDSPIKWDFLW
jgi:transposase